MAKSGFSYEERGYLSKAATPRLEVYDPIFDQHRDSDGDDNPEMIGPWAKKMAWRDHLEAGYSNINFGKHGDYAYTREE